MTQKNIPPLAGPELAHGPVRSGRPMRIGHPGSAGFRVVIVGPIPLDEIVRADGTTQWHYGGAVYPLAAYATLAEGTSDRVALVSHVDPADADWLRRTFGDDPHVDLSGVTSQTNDGACITLRYQDHDRRQGIQRRQMTPMRPADVRPFLDADAFILLPLTDEELPPETLRYVSENSRGLILLDAHGPLTHVGPGGARQPTTWTDAERYLADVNVLKMNRAEAQRFFGVLSSDETYARAAARLLVGRLQVVWVTSGDQSSLVVFRRPGHASAYWACVPTVTDLGPVPDTTGAGDAAAAGFVFGYLRSRGAPLFSAAAGNTIGSMKAVTPGGQALPERSQVRGLMTAHYGGFLRAAVEDFLQRSGVIVHLIPLPPDDVAGQGIT